MTDLPDPAADGAAAHTGDPDLAALVRRGSKPPVDGDPELAALVKLGQRPVRAAVPAARAKSASKSAKSGRVAAAEAETTAVVSGPAEAEPASVVPVAATTEAATDTPAADAPTPAEPATGAAVDVEADTIGTETAPEALVADAAPELPIAAVVAQPAADAPRRGRSLALRFAFAFLFGVALVVGVGAGALYAWGQQYDGRVLPGVRVGTTDLSGLTRDQAQAAIAKAYASLGAGTVTLTGPDGPVTIAYSDIARGPDTAAILDAALAAGRGGEPLANLIGAPQSALHGITLASAVTYDHAKLTAAVDALAATLDQTAVDAVVTVDPSTGYAVSPAKDGRAVDKASLLAALDQKLAALDSPAEITLDVPVATVPAAVQTAAADAAKAAADRITANLAVTWGSSSWTITSAQLRPLVSFAAAADGTITTSINQTALTPLVGALAQQINQTPVEGTLKLVGKHVVAGGKYREGRTLDVAATTALVGTQLAARQAGTASTSLTAVVKVVPPKLGADLAATAAKMIPISTFSVYYWVIINNHFGGNIEGPANVINGTVVPAGGTFDFWKVVGDLHRVPGVGPGNAIEGGKITVTGAFGGGICTTSTTLFNAAIHAGMIPLARQNHNEFIDRYPAGLDATVWIVGNTKQTMSFKNDTAYPILIQRVITYAGSKRWLTFKIWSVPNGRKTLITNTVIQPGARAVDTVVKDPTKPVGYSYRNNAAVNGAKVWVTVSIYDHGKLHWSKRYYSNYPPVNGVLIVGTKAAL